jgi:hypothetical protein
MLSISIYLMIPYHKEYGKQTGCSFSSYLFIYIYIYIYIYAHTIQYKLVYIYKEGLFKACNAMLYDYKRKDI